MLPYFLFSPLGKLAGRAIYFCVLFSRSAKLLKGLYILPMFFLYFLILLMVDILDPVAQNLVDRSSPKFQD